MLMVTLVLMKLFVLLTFSAQYFHPSISLDVRLIEMLLLKLKLLLKLIMCQFFFSPVLTGVTINILNLVFSQLNCSCEYLVRSQLCLCLSAGANVHRHADGLRHLLHAC